MERIVIDITTDGDYRATETVADLRNAAETLYFPMRLVGFWDKRADMHLCPQEERRQPCPHGLPEDDPAARRLRAAATADRGGSLEVFYPHAGVAIYLG